MDLKENRCVLSFFPAEDVPCSCVPGLLNLPLEGRQGQILKGWLGNQNVISGREWGRAQWGSELNILKSRRVCEEWEIFRRAIGSTELEFTRGF